jgi:hypothetical protein
MVIYTFLKMCDDNELQERYSNMNKLEYPEKGLTIYYPKQYQSYEEFKEKNVEIQYIELLKERLNILRDFEILSNETAVDITEESLEYLYCKNCLCRNEIAIEALKKYDYQGILNSIEDYEYKTLNNHISHIMSILKEKL